MKKFPAFAALALALTATLSCEQQTWDQTKMFNQNRHGAHGETHGAGHDAAKPAAHEVKADAHAPAAAH